MLDYSFNNGALSGVKRQRRESDNSLPTSAETKNTWSYACTPYIHRHACRAQEQLYLYYFERS
jgi:hypothetical protein